MSFRGRGGRGGSRGRGGFRGGGRGRGRGGGGGYDTGPPERVTELGVVLHPCENDLVCKGTNASIPYFNAPIYLENKSQIGKVDEIFGPMNEFLFSVKVGPDMQASSFNKGHKFYIDPFKLLPLSRFLPKPKGSTGRVEKPRGGGRGRGPSRGRGGFRGGGRGGSRGGFSRGRGGGGRGRGRGRGR